MPLIIIVLAGILVMTAAPLSAKTASNIVTAEMRRNAVRNVERYDWARAQRDALIARVKPYLEMSDEQIWKLPISQDMPRDFYVNNTMGCPNCLREHYSTKTVRWKVDLLGKPWQVQCGNCEIVLPSNDFAAYYDSSLDEQHKFRHGKGDAQYLQPRPGSENTFIDDGHGIEAHGTRFFAAAHYAFRRWQEIIAVTETLAKLYTLTDDPIYAHKAGILLGRVADLYPEMDYKAHYHLGVEASTGGTGNGRVQGMIWECWTADKFSVAYDSVYDALIVDEALAVFSQQMSQRYGTGNKSTARAIAAHIEEHLLKEFIKGVFDRRINGNSGMHQYAMAAAIALDDPTTTEPALDWLFAENNPKWGLDPYGGGVPYVMHEQLSRDGLSDEAGAGYAAIPINSFIEVADLLRDYSRYQRHDLYRDYPKFRHGFTASAKIRIAEVFRPAYGDDGGCMTGYGHHGRLIGVPRLLRAYRAYGVPEIAHEIYYANGRRLDNLPGDIYDAEPAALIERIRRDASDMPDELRSMNTSGYGIAILHAPSMKYPRGLSIYYGRNGGHGHQDRLAINMVAQNINAVPDNGYPLYTGADPHRIGWVSHVISHNTVMVDDAPQGRNSWSGRTRLFSEEGAVRVADIDGDPSIYSGVNTYRRCVVMVDVDEAESYFLDLFWVRGGKSHRLIQTAGGPEATHSGLPLAAQEGGTYAGPNVAYGEFYDFPRNWSYSGTGFQYLDRVEKSSPGAALKEFWVDWRLVEPQRPMPEEWRANLRVHNLTPLDEVTLADGHPPEHGYNPKTLRYLLRVRRGENLASQFISVLEPYGKAPLIRSVRLLNEGADADGFAVAVEVTLSGSRRDVILVREDHGTLKGGDVELNGRVGVVRFADGAPVRMTLIDGTRLRADDREVTLPPALEGRLAGWDDSDDTDIRLKLVEPLPQRHDLVGRYILIANTERSDASYRIEKVVDGQTLSIGGQSLVERFVDPLDYGKGLIHNVEPGQAYRIPLSTTE